MQDAAYHRGIGLSPLGLNFGVQETMAIGIDWTELVEMLVNR